MKVNYVIILLAVFFSLPESSYCQEKKIIRRRIEIGQDPTDDKRSLDAGMRYAITIEPTKIISGEVPVTLQFAPTDWLVLEGGLGLTWENYFMDLFEEFAAETPYSIEGDVNINPSYVIGAKFFPEMDVFYDEYYLGIQLTHRKYSENFTYEGETYEAGKTFKDISLLYGAHYSTGIDWIFIDSYSGIGIRLVDEFGLTEEGFNTVTQDYNYVPYQENRSTIGFVMGIKVGVLLD